MIFDYWAMHDNCWSVLLQIRGEIDKIKGEAWSKQYKVDQQNLPFVVGAAFSVAAGKLNVDEGIEPSMGLLEAEGRVVDEWLAER